MQTPQGRSRGTKGLKYPIQRCWRTEGALNDVYMVGRSCVLITDIKASASGSFKQVLSESRLVGSPEIIGLADSESQ